MKKNVYYTLNFTGLPGRDGKKGVRGDDCGYCAPGYTIY